jgi:hypothetical protein
MRQMLSKIKDAGHEAVFQYAGITVMLGGVTIAIGQDGDLFTAYVQQDMPEGPVHSSEDDMTEAAVLQLCSRYASTASVAA